MGHPDHELSSASSANSRQSVRSKPLIGCDGLRLLISSVKARPNWSTSGEISIYYNNYYQEYLNRHSYCEVRVVWNWIMQTGNRVEVAFFHIDGETLGGHSKMLLQLLEGINTELIAPKLILQCEGRLYEEAQDLDIDLEVVPYKGILDNYNRSLLSYSPILQSRNLFRILQYNHSTHSKVQKADVIWCENLRVVLTLLPNILKTNSPVIWDIGLGLNSEGVIKYLNSMSLRSVDQVIIESINQANRIFTNGQLNKYGSKFKYINKGIDTNHFTPSNYSVEAGRGYQIGTLAPISPRKGIHYLIDSFYHVQQSWDDVELKIPSEPPDKHVDYYEYLQEIVNDYGIEDKVTFMGWVDDPAEYLTSLDIFVLPSENEGIPGAIKEALAMELPVVATDVGGISDVIQDGESGILVEPGDPEAIADGIDFLLTHPEERIRMGTRGRGLIVSEYSVESYIEKYQIELLNFAQIKQ